MANVQQIAQNAVDIAGLGEISSVVDSADRLSRLTRRLFNQTGKDIALLKNAFEQGWVALNREYEFTTDTDVEEYALPADFVELVGGTVWDRDSYYEARGPLTPHEWQAVRSGLVESATLTPAIGYGGRQMQLNGHFSSTRYPQAATRLCLNTCLTGGLTATEHQPT